MKLFRQPGLWITFCFVALAAVGFALRARTRNRWGFKDAVKNPGQWASEIQRAHQNYVRAIEEAKGWNDAQVEEAVEHFVFNISSSSEAKLEEKILESLGTKVQPAIIKILDDRAKYARLVKPTGTNLLPEAPFNRACLVLGNFPPAEAAEPAIRFLADPSVNIRRDAAGVLGGIGTPAVVKSLRQVMSDSDEYVRSRGLRSMQWAMQHGRWEKEAARELYADIAELVVAGKNTDISAQLLMDMNPSGATNLFLSDRVFNADAPALHDVLLALAEQRVNVARDRLLALISDLESPNRLNPNSRALAVALRLLGQKQTLEDEGFLKLRTDSPDDIVASGAVNGLIALANLEGCDQRAWDSLKAHGFSALNPQQQHFVAVLIFDGEVNNGGLSQYFFNSSGDYWQEALAGLKTMGSSERLAVLSEAVAKFGKDGPARDRERRQEQLAKLERKGDAVFNPLDDRYYKCKEVIYVLAKKFVLNNADAFK